MGTKQRIKFTVTFGDWSDDGHGKTRSTSVEIFSTGAKELTEKRILKSYRANVAKLGFGLPELWEDYEQYSVSEDHLFAIGEKLGAVYYTSGGGKLYGDGDEALKVQDLAKVDNPAELPANSFVLDKDSYDSFWLSASGSSLKLAMFITLAGLKQVDWRELKVRNLFGQAGSLLTGNDHVGYGLLS